MRGETMDELSLPEELRRAAAFHGHLCPGLVIGYRAVKAAMDRGILRRARDEEMVARVENDSCSVDAVQTLAGCTFGKGNLLFRDYGKQVFTFWNRETGKAIRVALTIHRTPRSGEDASSQRQEWLRTLLDMEEGMLFSISPVQEPPPPLARVFSTLPCSRCGEPVMQTRIRFLGGKAHCIPCAEEVTRCHE